jgi:hypothetical protein
MVGWDAAEPALIERLCAAGRLRRCSRCERAATAAYRWPAVRRRRLADVLHCKHVPWHGIYHNRLWRQARMRYETIARRVAARAAVLGGAAGHTRGIVDAYGRRRAPGNQ